MDDPNKAGYFEYYPTTKYLEGWKASTNIKYSSLHFKYKYLKKETRNPLFDLEIYKRRRRKELREMCTLEKRGNIFILTLTGTGEHRLNPTLLDEIQLALRQVRSQASTSSSSSVLITTAQGKFFSNGYDLNWAQNSQSRAILMDSKLRSIVSDIISLPMPTIAAVTGHASAAGYILALSHDYILMRKDRGFLYMSELDIQLRIPAWFVALVRSKISSSMARREVVLRATKLTAEKAVELGIVDSAHNGVEETLAAAITLGEHLIGRNWNGDVYVQIREETLSDVLESIRASGSGSRL